MSNEDLTWFKSSYSDGEGGDCVEAAYTWRKSTYSGGEGGDCLEVAACPHTVHVRDSKTPTGPHLTFSSASPWGEFLSYAVAFSRSFESTDSLSSA
ncbi:DUF397 domain-containing protein [Streptomyces soliscabiei]|uniref:DUF397 domain-containing protein n=1 Tax=Streptomyces soliscabiei TaxID=588897 RepID=UPI0029B74061|nr:DUF397 domain-containing protein [Streptomyces sp. NY05-11A]MDX2675897.1 DUF397 domain-containing protein [Streptomyces sp. NY05-11A]